jgi:hypothetical protein
MSSLSFKFQRVAGYNLTFTQRSSVMYSVAEFGCSVAQIRVSVARIRVQRSSDQGATKLRSGCSVAQIWCSVAQIKVQRSSNQSKA